MDTSDDENEKLKTKDITTFGSLIKQKLDLNNELYGLEYSGEKYKKMLIEIKKEMDSEEILPSDLDMYIIEYFGEE
uniref:Uncharacterized protein n=1 Tax=Meloidogyne javanica TaxID=6303 RepID=A0A915LGN6_MELJA